MENDLYIPILTFRELSGGTNDGTNGHKYGTRGTTTSILSDSP